MMKKKLLATLLTLSMTATTLAGATVVSAAEEHEPVELTISSGSQAVIRMTGIFPWKKNSWKSIHGSH